MPPTYSRIAKFGRFPFSAVTFESVGHRLSSVPDGVAFDGRPYPAESFRKDVASALDLVAEVEQKAAAVVQRHALDAKAATENQALSVAGKAKARVSVHSAALDSLARVGDEAQRLQGLVDGNRKLLEERCSFGHDPRHGEVREMLKALGPHEAQARIREALDRGDEVVLGAVTSTPLTFWTDFFGSLQRDSVLQMIGEKIAPQNAAYVEILGEAVGRFAVLGELHREILDMLNADNRAALRLLRGDDRAEAERLVSEAGDPRAGFVTVSGESVQATLRAQGIDPQTGRPVREIEAERSVADANAEVAPRSTGAAAGDV